MNPEIGKIFIVVGVLLTVFGLLAVNQVQIPWLGKLPGDIAIKKENFSFYFPITTSILISVILTVIFQLFKK